jgi:hypothetical protein
MRRAVLLGAAIVAMLASAGGPATAARRAHHPDQILSNETTYTRWAYVARVANIYAAASPHSRQVSRLHWTTEDGFPEIYLLLRAHWDRHGLKWVKLRIPGRPNGQVGWVEANALGRFHLTHQQVLVSRPRLRIYFYDSGHLVWSAPVAVGKPSTPTPPGHFWIRERFTLTDPSSGYYPYAFGTADYSTLTEWARGGVVGIHGPYYDPGGIPGYISHGCVRLRVPDDRWLGHHLKLGAPVRII